VRWLRGLLASTAMVASLTVVIALLDPQIPAQRLLMLYLLVVMPVAIVGGVRLAVVTAVMSAVVFRYLFADSESLTALGVFLITAVVVGQLAARLRRAALRSARLSEEQAALRRVATLVARSAPPSEVFKAVTCEVGQLCGADLRTHGAIRGRRDRDRRGRLEQAAGRPGRRDADGPRRAEHRA
jgi:K+-sensing histidine kinase KdpD